MTTSIGSMGVHYVIAHRRLLQVPIMCTMIYLLFAQNIKDKSKGLSKVVLIRRLPQSRSMPIQGR